MRFFRFFFGLKGFILAWIAAASGFFSFREIPSVWDSQSRYWCVSYQSFSEIHRISEKDWQRSSQSSNFPFFWFSGPLGNVAKGINTYRRFYESPRMMDNEFRVLRECFSAI
jgi:hypothetical protein